MIADAGARVVVTRTGDAGDLPAGLEIVALDDPAVVDRLRDLPGEPVTDGERREPLLPGHPAYVIFTSGSTGRPKGVVISHAAIANRVQAVQRERPLGDDDRLLQRAAIGFDQSVVELFWPLTAGAAVVLPRPGAQRDPYELAALMARERVTSVDFVPSMLDAFLGVPELAGRPGLGRGAARRQSGGEALGTRHRHALVSRPRAWRSATTTAPPRTRSTRPSTAMIRPDAGGRRERADRPPRPRARRR